MMDQKKEDNHKKKKPKSFYQDYFDQYEEIQVLKRDGSGTEVRRVYIGDYYEQDIPKGWRILVRGFYLMAWLAAAALYWFGASAPVGSNLVWYVTLPEAVAVPFLFWMGWIFINYVPAIGKMKDWDYRHTAAPLKRASLVAGAALTAVAGMKIIYCISHLNTDGIRALVYAGYFAVSAALVFFIYRVEQRIPYRVIPNKTKIQEEAFDGY